MAVITAFAVLSFIPMGKSASAANLAMDYEHEVRNLSNGSLIGYFTMSNGVVEVVHKYQPELTPEEAVGNDLKFGNWRVRLSFTASGRYVSAWVATQFFVSIRGTFMNGGVMENKTVVNEYFSDGLNPFFFVVNSSVTQTEVEYSAYLNTGTAIWQYILNQTYYLDIKCGLYINGEGNSIFTIPFTFGEAPTEVIELPETPVKPHHTFAGWYLDEQLTVPYIGQLITSEMNFYAKWTLNDYTVSFVTGVAGYELPSVTVPALTVPQGVIPVRTGYDFSGWFSDMARTIPYDINAPLEGNITLYAGWTAQVFTVIFLVDGVEYARIEVIYGTAFLDIIKALNSAYNVSVKFDGVSVTDIVTDNIVVTGKAPKTLKGKLIDFFGAYWGWFALGGGLLLVGVIGGVIMKRKGVI